MKRNFFIYFLMVLSLLSCDKKTIFNENKELENAKWFVKDEAKFDFIIEDPNQKLNFYYNLRNNLTYPYYNLYVTRYLYDEKGKLIHEKLDEIILADEKTGRSLGSGLGDIFDHKVLITSDLPITKKGKYTLKIRQFMRQNPLPDILSIGITIEKKL